MPPPITYKTVTGTYKSPDGSAVAGTLRFIPSTTVLDSTGHVVVPPTPVTAALSGAGTFSVELGCTDVAGTTPTGWVWQLSELFAGGRETTFQLPSAGPSTVYLADLVEASTVDETWQYVLLSDINAWKATVEADVDTLTGRVDTVESAVSIALTVDLLNQLTMGVTG